MICSQGESPHYDRARQTIRPAVYPRAAHHGVDVLNWLAAGMTEQQILDDYPELESDDFRAVYEFAARLGRRVAL
ncbi:hypothetical protein SBA3_430024 [Candidatus Sulfopaludibacter sp. SbA3]|nr:hypothetical protein SBA3_430024 [Candidatus Sulfopaludibacter sp. SbA3]